MIWVGYVERIYWRDWKCKIKFLQRNRKDVNHLLKPKHKREHDIKTDLNEKRGECVGRFIGHKKLTSGRHLRHCNEIPGCKICGDFFLPAE